MEDVWAKLLATALAHILGESEVETPGDRLCNVKVKALTDILADSLTQEDTKTLGDTRCVERLKELNASFHASGVGGKWDYFSCCRTP